MKNIFLKTCSHGRIESVYWSAVRIN